MGDMDSARSGGRAGERWTPGDYETLVEGLRDGLVLEDLAEKLGRSASATRTQLRRLVPRDVDAEIKPRDREAWLRERLAAGDGYDWLAVLREHSRAEGQHFFTGEDERLLLRAWDERTPLRELVGQLSASETHIARHLIVLGLAHGVADVVERLGATEEGTLDVRMRLAVDRAASSVWVLVVDGAAGVGRNRELNLRRHVSVHATQDAALAELDGQIAEHDHRGSAEQVYWSIVERTAGESTIGTGSHGVYDPTSGDSGGEADEPPF
ncbi:MAG: hypothetical protein GEU98_19825 [Pseudonocardiaceae bacterium]|nr:hypothetical protein [Pseudonocardiaceae bacterium]